MSVEQRVASTWLHVAGNLCRKTWARLEMAWLDVGLSLKFKGRAPLPIYILSSQHGDLLQKHAFPGKKKPS